MSALKQQSIWMSEAEYLAFEHNSESKQEYIAGEVFAMAGASRAHNLISVNLVTLLRTQLRGTECKVFPADMRVRIEKTRVYTYPDLSIVCGDEHYADDVFDTLTNPSVLIEILSPFTEQYDRSKKFQDYRELESLREYLIVSQSSPRIEHYLRQDLGSGNLVTP